MVLLVLFVGVIVLVILPGVVLLTSTINSFINSTTTNIKQSIAMGNNSNKSFERVTVLLRNLLTHRHHHRHIHGAHLCHVDTFVSDFHYDYNHEPQRQYFHKHHHQHTHNSHNHHIQKVSH